VFLYVITERFCLVTLYLLMKKLVVARVIFHLVLYLLIQGN